MKPTLKKTRIQEQQIQVCELTVSYNKGKIGPQIASSKDAADILRNLFSDRSNFCEEFAILTLNRRNCVIGFYRVSQGGVSGTVVDPKIVFSTALGCLASAVILCHNHPSGNLEPSRADLVLTEKLISGGQLLEISVLDHIILTDETYLSLADEGHIRYG